MASRDGVWLILMSLCLIIVFAISSLIIKIFIFGPATYILRDTGWLMAVVWPFIYIVYGIVLTILGLGVAFILLLCLHQHWNQKELLFGFEVLGEEKRRFGLILKSFALAVQRVAIGTVKGVYPGIKALFDFALIYPLCVFEFTEGLSSDQVLQKSERLMQGHEVEMGIFTMVLVGLFLAVQFFIWNVFIQLLLWTILLSYGMTTYVFYYKYRNQ